jgi:hypothetical protein
MELYNYQGKQLMNKSFQFNTSTATEVDISSYAPGIYFLKLYASDSFDVIKLIIED